MGINGKAYIAGIYEHPTRFAAEKTLPQLHAEIAKGALADAGLGKDDVDAYFCAGDAPGLGGISMIEYLGLNNVRHMDSTETGGSSYIVHVNHAAHTMTVQAQVVANVDADGATLSRLVRAEQRWQRRVHTVEQAVKEGDRPGAAANPDLKEER